MLFAKEELKLQLWIECISRRRIAAGFLRGTPITCVMANISKVIGQLPSMLIARAATVTIVTRETVLSNIISILAREVSGSTSVGLNAVAVENARNR
jgi:hypothetical protein